ncbi:MAG: hypothetical protein NZ701_13620, partial [Roseiflexus sp.]|nr:hypothetical protein [Roseiflexus sp.]
SPPDCRGIAQGERRRSSSGNPDRFLSGRAERERRVPFYTTNGTHPYSSIANREQELLRELERRGLFVTVVRIGAITLMQRTSAPLPDSCFGTGWQDAICHIK